MFSWNFRSLLLYSIVVQLNAHYVKTTWPSPNASSIQLLGLFQYVENSSDPTKSTSHSHAMFKAAILLSQLYNITIEGQFIGWQAAQTDGNVIEALNDACQAVSTSNIVGIVGPVYSREAHTVAEFSERIGLPVISYAATDPELSDRQGHPTFYRTVPSDNATALALVKLFIRYNWTSCVIIYQNDAFGTGGAKVISDVLVDNGLIVREMIVFHMATLSFQSDLKISLTNAASRIVILWAGATYTSIILQKALDVGVLGPLFTWILSTTVPFNFSNDAFSQNLIGMLTIQPVTGAVVGAPINTSLLTAAYNIWQKYDLESFPGPLDVNNYALFAFDATWALILALQKLCSTIINNSSCLSFVGSSYCFDRRFVNSDLLMNILSQTEFLGVSGLIKFSDNVTDRINGSYYYAQNVQPTSNGLAFVPVLDYSDPGNWKAYSGTNTIIWPNNSLIPPTGQAMLQGVSLQICIIQSLQFTIITNVFDASGKNTTKYTGYIPDLIDLLQAKIGFIPTIHLAPLNQSYTDLIKASVGGPYDLIIGDVTVTASRRELVEFSSAIFDNSLRIIMRKSPDVNYDLLSFLKPFSRNLWLLILGACIYAGLLLCILEREDNKELQDRSIVSQIVKSLWYSFGNIVGYGVEYNVTTASGRLLTVGLYILSLILVASYTANLVSDLTIAKSKDIISGLDDIKSGKIPFNRIGIRIGTAGEDFYLRQVSGGSRNYYLLHSTEEMYNSLLAGIIDVSFVDSGAAEYMTNNVYCNLTLVGEGFDRGVFGIVTPKDWLYAQDLDVNILSLRESGDLDNLQNKWFGRKTCPDSFEKSAGMEMESMGGLFLIFGVISVLSLLLFAWSKRPRCEDCYIVLRHQAKSLLLKTRRHCTA